MSAIEVLKKIDLLAQAIDDDEIIYRFDRKEIADLKKALLALESLDRLEKWLDKKYNENWFVLTNNKDLEEARIIRNFIKEVRGVLENDC